MDLDWNSAVNADELLKRIRTLVSRESQTEAPRETPGATQLLADIRHLLDTLPPTAPTTDQDQQDGTGTTDAGRRVQRALAAFQDKVEVDQLINHVGRAGCELGFHRILFSTVQNSTWVTESAYVDDDPGLADVVVGAGRQHPLRLTPGLPEFTVVRGRRSVVVEDVDSHPQLHHAVTDAARTKSYVVAPVWHRSRVVGFLHADRYRERSPLTDLDAEVLSAFTQGFSYALYSATLMQQLRQLRENVGSFGDSLRALSMGNALADLEADRQTPVATASPAQTAAPLAEDLTRREREILELLAEGYTNRRIADRLVIAEGTVKSHVKHILDKLNASNRSEAAARWRSIHQVPAAHR